MRFRFVFIFCALLVAMTASATDSLMLKVKNNVSPATNFTGFIKQNPSAMLYARYSDITEFGATIGRNNGEAALLQDGTRKDEYNLYVNTMQHLQGNQMVWGSVLYRRGDKDNVKWNESADYSIVYPYVINDTVGGDNLKMEEYSFSGGYAHNSDKWMLGIELDYRALKEYRTLDPRPDNTASDLYFRGGASYKLVTDYIMGAGIYYRKYKQENILSFYNKLGAPWIYHDTGLGTNAYMFAGSNDEAMLDGGGYGVNLQLIPGNFYGLTSSIAYDHFYFEKQLEDESYLPISEINENKFSADIAYTQKTNNHTYGTKFSATYRSREGTEHLYNITATRSYEKISSVDMYSHRVITAELSLLYGIENKSKLSWYISPSVVYTDSKEKYKNPQRKMDFSSVSEGMKGYLFTPLKKVLVSANASVYLTQNVNKALLLTNLEATSYANYILHQNYAFLSSNSITCQASLRGDYPISKSIVLFFKADGAYASHNHELNRYEANISVGVVF